MAEQQADAGHRLVLGADATIRTVAALHHQLMEQASVPALVTIDASQVGRVDTAALQALVAFVRERRGQGHGIAWEGISDRFAAVAAQLGLVRELGLPAIDPS